VSSADKSAGTIKQALLTVPGVRPAVEGVYGGINRRRQRRWQREIEERDRRTVRSLAGRRDLRLNVGSSGNHLDGWLSIDIRPDEVCFGMDATKPWPFESGSAEAINSEHFIEHLTLDEARRYLAEAYRVLRSGGLIRTTTPNLGGLVELFTGADPRMLEVHRSHGYEAATHGDMFNNYFYSWEHRHIYDFESLATLLRGAGFEDVREASFGESTHELLRGIDRHDPEELRRSVLCVDAVKPT
jgi:predicted SAM-dependent methyltransferase